LTNVGIEALFNALGLQPLWMMKDVQLDTAEQRINFDIEALLSG